MNQVSSESLFHFTKTKKAFFSILKIAPRFSYCAESFPGGCFPPENDEYGAFLRTLMSSHVYVLMPMICFCDIPITQTTFHEKRYGSYVIGFDKKTLLDAVSMIGWSTLNPVLYYNDNDVAMMLTQLVNKVDTSNNETTTPTNDGFRLFGLFKPYRGYGKDENYVYYNEREWRILLNYREICEELKWQVIRDKNQALTEVKKLNEKLHTSNHWKIPMSVQPQKLSQFIQKLVTHIIVRHESQIPSVAKYILNERNDLFGITAKKIDDETRKLLITRITSMERIRKDY
jgi:hypothetical protein